jgi:hypothetical protein
VIEVLAAGVAVAGGVASGAAITRTTWPTLGRVAAVLALTVVVFFIGGRIGVLQEAAEARASLGENIGSILVVLFAGISWAVIGAMLWLAGMLAGWMIVVRRRGRG